jgi:hypothetical protein
MIMESIACQIEKEIKRRSRGKLYFNSDFAAYGSPEAIKKTLQRLEKAKSLMRVAHGIYYYPKIEAKWGNAIIPPTIEEIAQGIAKRDKVRIIPTGVYSLNALGLSTQVPANIVFITDGAARRISIGKGKGILFKHSSETRIFAYKSKILMLIVSALREIGEDNCTETQLAIIKKHLQQVPKSEFNSDIQLAPLWVRKTLLSL